DSVVTVRRTPQVQPIAATVRCSGPPTPPLHPLETRPLAADPHWVHRRPTPPVLIHRQPTPRGAFRRRPTRSPIAAPVAARLLARPVGFRRSRPRPVRALRRARTLELECFRPVAERLRRVRSLRRRHPIRLPDLRSAPHAPFRRGRR